MAFSQYAEETSNRLDQSGEDRHRALWDSIARTRERIHSLNDIVGPLTSLQSLQESEFPAQTLLADESVARTIISRFTSPQSGHRQDPICQWLYDTFQTNDPDLQNVVLRYIPALCGIYLPRITMQSDDSMAGFEAVLLALYTVEMKARNGQPVTLSIPDISQPSLYIAPRKVFRSSSKPTLGQLSAPLEPQDAIKATKRASIVAVALNLFLSRIAFMPSKVKIEACQVALRWASLSCSRYRTNTAAVTDAVKENADVGLELNHNLGSQSPGRNIPEIQIHGAEEPVLGKNLSTSANLNTMKIEPLKSVATESSSLESVKGDFLWHLRQAGDGTRIPLQWDLLQPIIRILSHCLLAPLSPGELKNAASTAIKALHFRVFHDLIPEAMLATRSLMQLEIASRTRSEALSISGNSASS